MTDSEHDGAALCKFQCYDCGHNHTGEYKEGWWSCPACGSQQPQVNRPFVSDTFLDTAYGAFSSAVRSVATLSTGDAAGGLSKDTDEEEVRKSFASFDQDGSGQLDFPEFKRLMTTVGEHPFADAELHALMLNVDLDGNGTICVEEYIHWLFQEDDGKGGSLASYRH